MEAVVGLEVEGDFLEAEVVVGGDILPCDETLINFLNYPT